LPEYAQIHLPNKSTLIQASKDDCSSGRIRMGRRWTGAFGLGVGGGIENIRDGEGAQHRAASQAVSDTLPGNSVELVPSAWKQAPGQFTQHWQSGEGNRREPEDSTRQKRLISGLQGLVLRLDQLIEELCTTEQHRNITLRIILHYLIKLSF
jgi:hypothetical protein